MMSIGSMKNLVISEKSYWNSEIILRSDFIDLSSYVVFRYKNELRVSKDGNVLISTDGSSYLIVKGVEYKNPSIVLSHLSSDHGSALINWFPKSEKKWGMSSHVDVTLQNCTYEIVKHRGFLSAYHVTVSTEPTNDDFDFDFMLGCGCFFWLRFDDLDRM